MLKTLEKVLKKLGKLREDSKIRKRFRKAKKVINILLKNYHYHHQLNTFFKKTSRQSQKREIL